MIALSNAAKARIAEGIGYYIQQITMTLKNGTVFYITNEDLLGDSGIEIEDATSSSGKLDVGASIINSCRFTLMNFDDKFTGHEFYGASLIVKVGIELDGSIEYLDKGRFTVTDAVYSDASVSITAYDNMAKFDRDYSESHLVYPTTIGSIVNDACTVCGVVNATQTFTNSNLVIPTRPDDNALTFREVLSWCAQIAGCFARINRSGQLELKWYDVANIGNDSASQATVYHNVTGVFSQKTGTNDTVITGLRATVKSDVNGENDITYHYGVSGYEIEFSGNAFITKDNAMSILQTVGNKIVGMRFRKMEITHLSDPSFEAGDLVRIPSGRGYDDGLAVNSKQLIVNNKELLVSKRGLYFWGIVSYTKFTAGSSQTTRSDSEEVAINSAARYSEITKAVLAGRESLSREITAREEAVRQLAERIATSSGLYITEDVQPDQSVIYYAHNKPTLAESDIVWKFTAEAFAISTDGGETYPYGLDVSGTAILNRIFAESVDASSGTIHGTFEVKDTEGNTVFLINADTGRAYIGSESVTTAGGEDLQTVLDGYADAAKVYTLESSDNIIIQSADGTLSSSDVVFTAFVKDGAEPRQAYPGRFGIEETRDGITWTTVYTSQADESWIAWSLLEAILAEGGVELLAEGEETLDAGIRDISRIRCTLYASGGTAEILDRQTVVITSERAGLSVILSNETVTIAADNAGNVGDYLECYTDIQVYYGTRDVTASASIIYSPGPGVQADFDGSVQRCSVSRVDGADGYVDFTVAFQGTEINRRFTVSKAMKGENGAAGIDGIDGEDGLPGVSSYFHLAYANSQDGTEDFSLSDTSGRKYIGTYTDTVQADSTNPARYKWMLAQGIQGDQGIPGTDGADGKTQYLHIAYATNSTGTEGFSPTVSAGKTHIGTYVDFTQADSTDPSKYAWSLIKGDKGDTGEKGATGDKGDKGDKGDTGEAGRDALMPAILCDKSASVSKDRTETLTMTAIIYDSTGNDVDPSGNIYRYAWYIARDGETESYPVGRGKQLAVRVDALLCEDYAGVYFETVEDDADFRLLADTGVELLAADSEPLLIA